LVLSSFSVRESDRNRDKNRDKNTDTDVDIDIDTETDTHNRGFHGDVTSVLGFLKKAGEWSAALWSVLECEVSHGILE